ncbi:hypothetical protein ACFYTC_18465 [Actinomadura nitritigenes]|uniref:hypothetical protein n=1 Tax=Actinomadura nitritigenes TaxID=134602 RepID=UPI0036CF2841
MAEDGKTKPPSMTRRNRRTHRDPRRSRGISITLSEEEYASLSAAAEREHLATGAWAAKALLAEVRGTARADSVQLRELLEAVLEARAQTKRIGVNLNQAVAAVNSGEMATTLQWYADAVARTVRKLDELAEELRTRLP